MFRIDISQHQKTELLRKLRKKAYSLLVPYLIWNTLGFLFFFTITHIPALRATVNGGEVVHLTVENLFTGIFLHEYYFSFWFMQDLIALTAVSPVILLFLRDRRLAYATAVGITVLMLLNINLWVCQPSSLLLFFLGGILAVYHRDFWERANQNICETLFWALLFLLYAVVKWLKFPCISTIALIISPIIFWKAFDFLDLFNIFDHEPSWFCKQSFFIYAAHIIPVDAVNGLLARINSTMAWASMSYMITPLLVLLMIYTAAKILDNRFPKIYRLLCGGRK